MKASPRQQRLLLALQELDTARDRLLRKRSHLPEAEQLRDLSKRDSELREAFMSAQREVEDLAQAIARMEDDVDVVNQRYGRTSERLGASVSGKEAQALQEEIDMLARRREALETRELELMEEHEKATARLDRAQQDISEHDRAKRALETAVGRAEQDIDAELERIATERAGLAAEIQGNLRDVYERTRERYGIGAARLVGRVSEGSNLELDAADYSAAMATPDDELFFCPVSGAILVRNWGDSTEGSEETESTVDSETGMGR